MDIHEENLVGLEAKILQQSTSCHQNEKESSGEVH